MQQSREDAMKRIVATIVGIIAGLLWAGGVAAVSDAQYQAIRGLGELNGIALQCHYLDQTRRMKKALVEALPKRRALGQGFDDVTNEAFLRFIEEKARCPERAEFEQRVGEAIQVLRRAFPNPPTDQ